MEIQENQIVIKQFEDLNIQIYGTHEAPLFKANDIGDLLDIKHIRDTVAKLDDECKVLKVADTIGGLQEQWFLTEDGLYEILFISRKPVAKQFKVWVRDVIKEIRKTGKYENQKFIQNETKSNTLIEQYKNKDVLYLAFVKEFDEYVLVKYGITQFVEETLTRHRDTYGKQVYYIYITECKNRDKLERKIQTHTDLISRHVKEFDDKPRKELLRVDKNFTMNKLIELIESLKESMTLKYESHHSIELELAKELTKQKELDNVRYIEETKQKELEISVELKKLELEMRKLNNAVQEVQEVPVVQDLNQDLIIKEFFDRNTVHSSNSLDTIKMTSIYSKFVEYAKEHYPVYCIPSNRGFTPKFKKLKLGNYKTSIPNLNGTSGITNRKFK